MKIGLKKRQVGSSLTTTLATAFFALSAVVLLISSGVQIFSNFRTQREIIFNQQQLIAQSAATQVINFIDDQVSAMRTAVKLADITTASAEEQQQVLNKMLSLQPAFRQTVLFDAQDQKLVSASRLSQAEVDAFKDRLEPDLFNQVRQTNSYISPVSVDAITGEPLIIIAVPATDIFGDVQGTLVSEVNLKFMWDLVDQLKVGEIGQAYVVDKDGTLLAYHDTGRVLKGENVSYLPEVSEFVAGDLTDEDGANIGAGIDGTNSISTFLALGTPNWAVVTELPAREAFAVVIQSALLSIAATLGIALLVGVVGAYMARRLVVPITDLTEAATRIASGELNLTAAVQGPTEVVSLADAFNSMTGQMRGLIGSLEERVTERTRDLELAAEVGRNVSEIKDITVLLQEAADLIRHRFNLYHVQIYLVDEEQEMLVLRASTGEAGKQLLAGGHRLPLDASSLNGRAAQEKETVLVADTAADPMFKPNPLLPDTVAEASIPLLVGNRAVGVLDLQSADVELLNAESLPAFETMSGQLAVAIDNAALFAERQQAAEALIPFRLGFERSPNAIFMTDIDGVINYVNPAFTKLYNYSAAEALGRTPQILQSGLMPQDQDEHFWQMLLNRQAVSIADELVSKTKDGRFVHVSANQSPVTNDNGEIIGFLALHTDISDRKMAEERLDRRVAELNCLNEIGRKVEESLPIPEFMEWVTARIKPVFKHTDSFMAAIMIGEIVYGVADAISQKRHIVEGLYIGNELIGNLYFSYADETLAFGDEDSSFIGAVGGRISSYVESRRLLEQLEHQATDLQQVAEIGTAVATILNPQELMQTFVDLTKSKFGLYHAHIYLFDVGTEVLKLTAGAGDIGQIMVAERRQIQLHKKQSLVAQAARSRQGVIVNDIRNETGFLPHPLLPETRAEMAVPLVVFDQLLGVLDVQADAVDAFSQADVSIFTTLATQMAVALQNAYQHKETQQTLEEVSALQRAMTHEGWHGYLTAKEKPVYGYVADQTHVRPITKSEQSQETNTVLLQKIRGDKTAVFTPVRLGSAAIGSLGVRTLPENTLSDEQQELLQAISEQVGQALERARLFEETEIARTQTESLYAGSSQIVRAKTMEDVLFALVHSTELQQMDRASIAVFDKSWDQNPEMSTITAVWAKQPGKQNIAPVGTANPIVQMLPLYPAGPDDVLIVSDVRADSRLNEQTRTFVQSQDICSVVNVPLVVGEQWFGMLSGMSQQPFTLDDETIRQLRGLTDQAATVIQSLRLYTAAEERAKELALINRIVSQMNAVQDIDSGLQFMAEELGNVLQVPLINVRLIDATGTMLKVVAARHPAEVPSPVGTVFPITKDPVNDALQARQTVIIEDVANADMPPQTQKRLLGAGIRSVYMIPMAVGRDLIGSMAMSILDGGSLLTPEQLKLAETMVQQVATAVQNTRLFTQEQERAAEMALINRVVLEMNSLQDVQTSLQFLVAELAGATQAGSAVINLMNADGTAHEVVAAHLPPGMPNPVGTVIPVAGDPLMDQIKQAMQTISIEDVTTAPFPPEIRDVILNSGIRSQYIIPMFTGRDLIGTTSLSVLEGERPLTSAQLKLAETLIFQATSVVQSIRLYAQSEQRATELSLINTVSDLASSQLELSNLFDSVGSLLQETFAAESIYFALYDQPTERITFPYFVSREADLQSAEPRSLSDGGVTGQIIESKKSLLRVWEPGLSRAALAAEGVEVAGSGRQAGSYLGTPMIVGREIVGVVAVSSDQEARTYNAEDQRLLETLAGTIGVAVQNARQFQEARRRAERESLINSISRKIQLATTVESALETAVSELGRALKLKKAIVELSTTTQSNGQS